MSSNVQVNDPALTTTSRHIHSRPSPRAPFEFATQGETIDGRAWTRNIVVGYNSSAGAIVEFFPGFGLAFTQLLFSGYSVSHDGGQSWVNSLRAARLI